ncbi:sensor histidine kinase [Clostridium amazonitimonense]|uniref:sensor histidine kinase n=1 Tax=Clostridium amazonitimonense TaxID=1499689 RepID=UPI0005A6A7E6|nr:HAMP domain-containing sensor histidine kinase [Clostridium amazonitimonense]
MRVVRDIKFRIRSIKFRIIGYYFITILITISLLGLVLWIGIKEYYYKTMESTLKDQVNLSTKFYSKYLNTSDVKRVYEDLEESFFSNLDVEVQILDRESRVIWDDLGIVPGTRLDYADIRRALQNDTAVWIGKPDGSYSSNKIMSVSAPLKIDSNIIGVLRVVSTMDLVDNLLKSIGILIAFVGLIVMVTTTILSAVISNTITRPLKKVTNAAKSMAKGQFDLKVEKIYEDEVGTMAETLNYMAQEINKSEKLKNEFISSISHELKTPLTSIKGWALTLKLKEFTDVEQREKGLDIIIQESKRLSLLVNELLDFSKFASAKMKVTLEEMNVGDLLEDIVLEMEPRIKRSNINLEYDIKPLPIIEGDRNRLKQVFINVIDNSLKFTEPGGTIQIKAELQGDFIDISIKDNGLGIKTEYLPKVKEKFYKGNSSKHGSGLGLAISDEIINLHGGSLDIISKYKNGTEVNIKLKVRNL